MSEHYDDAGFVLSSEYRVTVLHELSKAPATPSAMADRSGHAIAHISRTLGKLRERGLVDLLVSEDRRKGRIYGLTDYGREVLDTLDEMEARA